MSENKIEISAADIEAMQQAMLNSKEEIVIEEGRMTLRTEGLVKKYGERTVANNVSINVKQGEIVGLEHQFRSAHHLRFTILYRSAEKRRGGRRRPIHRRHSRRVAQYDMLHAGVKVGRQENCSTC